MDLTGSGNAGGGDRQRADIEAERKLTLHRAQALGKIFGNGPGQKVRIRNRIPDRAPPAGVAEGLIEQKRWGGHGPVMALAFGYG